MTAGGIRVKGNGWLVSSFVMTKARRCSDGGCYGKADMILAVLSSVLLYVGIESQKNKRQTQFFKCCLAIMPKVVTSRPTLVLV